MQEEYQSVVGATNAARKMSEEKFSMVKTLLNSNSFTIDQIAKMAAISPATVYNIRNASSLEDYRAQILAKTRIQAERRREKQAQEARTVAIYNESLEKAKNGDFTEAQLDELIKIGKAIENRLGQIVTMLGVPKSKEEELEQEGFSEERPF